MTDPASARAPVPCADMEPVRAEIDAIDRKLVALLAARQKCVEAAGRLKAERSMVVDEARIEEVIALVCQEAKERGLSESVAERLWRKLIALSIEHEYAIFDTK